MADLVDTLKQAAANLVNLRITTSVGDPAVQIVNGKLEVTGIDADAKSIVTNINMLEGDIWTALSPETVNGDLAEIRTYHEGLVTKAQEIVQRNMALLQGIVERFGGGAPPAQ
jgi:hypothetical protein